ncbi:hypothetical protein LOK49_LG02G01474 [Camellia lanceoleosa]|uniref:Uncharacterized protein n=1 Tax=Camellia lanceoleosa TaxID=1840588 RepID=A0ACC0IRA0_9ERIC|nr:hypothetical protein LOK49_LG02G01474 [Camellia lanceoleosa]
MSEVLNGKIMIISSGQSDAITRARPILSAMSEKLYVFEGALGAGSSGTTLIDETANNLFYTMGTSSSHGHGNDGDDTLIKVVLMN